MTFNLIRLEILLTHFRSTTALQIDYILENLLKCALCTTRHQNPLLTLNFNGFKSMFRIFARHSV